MARASEILAGTHRMQWNSDGWKKRRREWIRKYGAWCRSCRREDVLIHVHHIVYRKGVRLEDATDDELTGLCEDCHQRWHAVFNNLKMGLLGHVNVHDFAKIAASMIVGYKLHREAFFAAVAELVSNPGLISHLACRFKDGGKP